MHDSFSFNKIKDCMRPVKRLKTVQETVKDPSLVMSHEILVHILRFLDFRDVMRSSQLSVRWHKIARDQSLWKSLFLDSFVQTLPPKSTSTDQDSIMKRQTVKILCDQSVRLMNL